MPVAQLVQDVAHLGGRHGDADKDRHLLELGERSGLLRRLDLVELTQVQHIQLSLQTNQVPTAREPGRADSECQQGGDAHHWICAERRTAEAAAEPER